MGTRLIAVVLVAGVCATTGALGRPAKSPPDKGVQSAPKPEVSDQTQSAPAVDAAQCPALEPEQLHVEPHTQFIRALEVIPNPFLRLGTCPAGATCVDERKEGFGELSCRRADGTRDGAYASNQNGPTLPGGSPSAVAERGRYADGAREGVWFRFTYGMGPGVYEEQTYRAGKLTGSRRLVAQGAKAKRCRADCERDRQGCEDAQRSCRPGTPCLVRDCMGESKPCESACDSQVARPW